MSYVIAAYGITILSLVLYVRIRAGREWSMDGNRAAVCPRFGIA